MFDRSDDAVLTQLLEFCWADAAELPRMVERAGVEAGFYFPTYFHMLRHAAGYNFVNQGDGHSVASGLAQASEHPPHLHLHKAE